MKVFETDLVVGDEYYLDDTNECRGIFVGSFKLDQSTHLFFYPTSEKTYGQAADGTVPFPYCNWKYEEV